jgi:hypothetical protein
MNQEGDMKPETEGQPVATTRVAAIAQGGITLAASVLMWLALDDITTDYATTGYVPEYTMLTFCGAWFLFVAFSLWRRLRRAASAATLVATAALLVASLGGIGHVSAGGWSVFWPEYATIAVAWCWFVVSGVLLLLDGRRVAGPRPAPAYPKEQR